MKVQRVGIIGLGEVGRILAEDLLQHSPAQVRVWDHQFDNPASIAACNLQALQANPALFWADTADTAVTGCQLILSAVTADQALAAAESILPGLDKGAWFVDLNSVSPGTKQDISMAIEQAGSRFVEASVMSPIMPLRSNAPILLSGPHAESMQVASQELGFGDMRVVSSTLGVASATKMCRSVIVKGMEALVTESLLAARYYGVEDSVLASLDNLFPRPDWPEHARYLISRSLQHGTRRAAEMREVCKTVQEAGFSPWMSEGTVARQAWAPQFDAALAEESLTGLLDAIRGQLISNEN
jgi:3-hydroxyisobutyrate dehydrogenase